MACSAIYSATLSSISASDRAPVIQESSPPSGSSLRDLPPLRDVIARYGLSANRRLGQNFLLDLNLTRKIAALAGPLDGVAVVEIGPGPGGLTRALLESPAREIVAVERDPRCVEALSELDAIADGRLRVLREDALTIDPAALVEGPRAIVANLPYNIATRLLIGWLENATRYERLVLMFQKEVAERIAASPGSRTYGRLSVLAQWSCTVELALTLPARAFTPSPKVQSSLIVLTPRPRPIAPAPRQALERVTAAAFGQRRKMLRSSLRSLGVDPLPLLAASAIPETARAETLTVAEFCALARAFDRTPQNISDPSVTARRVSGRRRTRSD